MTELLLQPSCRASAAVCSRVYRLFTVAINCDVLDYAVLALLPVMEQFKLTETASESVSLREILRSISLAGKSGTPTFRLIQKASLADRRLCNRASPLRCLCPPFWIIGHYWLSARFNFK
jgi:hypothetical protein